MLFTVPELTVAEKEVIAKIDHVRTTLKYALSSPARWYGVLRKYTFARAIRGSNSIEGYNVTAEDALAAVEGVEPSEAEHTAWQAIIGYRNAMTYVLQLANDPHFKYDESLIRGLHYMMIGFDLTKNPGRWRPGPISIIDEQKREKVYDGPDAEIVPVLMRALVESLNAQDGGLPIMVRAAMSHLHLAMIHPFSDGNGRMARCLQTLVMAREGILEPTFCSIEEYLGDNTPEYYQVLADVGQGAWHPENDARPWIRFCLVAHFRQASNLLRRSKEMKRIWDELEAEIKKRSLPERYILALGDAVIGLRVKNSTYRSAAEISENVASRDLKEMVGLGFLVPAGEKRGRYYEGSSWARAVRDRTREPASNLDPFNIETLRLPGL